MIIIDTETTGLNIDGSDEILQLSIIDESYKVVFNKFFKPTKKQEWPDAESVNGISPSAVQFEGSLLTYKNEIENIINNSELVVGFNIKNFDIPMLQAAGLNVNPRNVCDVMIEMAPILGKWDSQKNDYRWSNLGWCCAHYAQKLFYNYNFHGAVADCRATFFVYNCMMHDPEKGKRAPGIQSKNNSFPLIRNDEQQNNISKLLQNSTGKNLSGVLIKQPITSGKYKNSYRFGCYVNNLCVGKTYPSHLENMKDLFTNHKLPDTIQAEVLLRKYNNDDNSITYWGITHIKEEENLTRYHYTVPPLLDDGWTIETEIKKFKEIDQYDNVKKYSTVPFTVRFFSDNNVVIMQRRLQQSEILYEPPIPKKDGCIFGGWYSNSYANGKRKISFPTHAKQNMDIYVRWIATTTIPLARKKQSAVSTRNITKPDVASGFVGCIFAIVVVLIFIFICVSCSRLF
jgi:DNA polymerase III epsilon subunit-like protein